MNVPTKERLAFKDQLRLLLRFAGAPAQALEVMSRTAPVAAAFLLLTALGLALQWALIPYVEQAAAHSLQDDLGATELRQTLAMMRKIQLLALLFYPFSLTAKWVLLGVVLTLMCQLLGGSATLRQGLSVCVHASLIPLLQAGQVYLILLLTGLESVNGPADLRPPIGLDLLWSADSPLALAVLHHINPFEAAYLAFLLAAAGRVNPSFSKLRTVAAVLPFWTMTVGLRLVLGTVEQSHSGVGAG